MVAASGLPFRTDSTNLDLSIPRNRVRHDVLPALARVSPAAVQSIARAARLAADDEDFLEECAIESASALVLTDEGATLRLDSTELRRLPPAVGRRVLRQALAKVAPGRFAAARHVEALWRLRSGRLDLPGVSASVESGRLSLRAASGRHETQERTNVFRYPLSIPGEAHVAEVGLSISAEIVIAGTLGTEKQVNAVVVSSSAVKRDGLFVRNRRPGDRFRPFGMAGSRKLQDYLVDRKVPRSERDRVPLVVDGDDRIVWVVGHTVAEDFRVTDPQQAVLLLKVRYFGGTV
jgi:tRNA(Ile)-lysidine synthase